jgi:N-acetylmuramoyl-L-alanine amidase
MIKIALQGGHLGATTGATGAPGEQELTRRIRTRLSEILISKGFQVFLFDAVVPQAQVNQDFNLFLALHGDAAIYGTGGGFADYPEPKTDGATLESQRITKVIIDSYFPETQIKYVNRSNANTRYYYVWKQLSPKTPCVIIEMGVVQDAHDKVLLGNTELIAGALARAICKALGVTYEVVVPAPTPVDPHVAEINALIIQLETAKKALQEAQSLSTQALALKTEECNQLLASNKLKFKADLKKFAEEY